VTQVSLYEADAYARWSAARLGLPLRLPSEAEWEVAAQSLPRAQSGPENFVERGALHPLPASLEAANSPMQMLGDTWEWTSSPYQAYPGYQPWTGAVGEYNGKFMVNQYVLRGGSCATPRQHIRVSYRNFFPAETRWQFSGLRLAWSLEARQARL
jgi:formylglycine-generating enzyme required for sulfatase activity